MVGERKRLLFLTGVEAAVDTGGVHPIEYLHGEEPKRTAVDATAGLHEANEGIVGLPAVGGAAVVDHTAAHGTGEWEPGMGAGEVSGLHQGAEPTELVRELVKAELGEDGEEEAVGGQGRTKGGEVAEGGRWAAAEEEEAEAAGSGREEGRGDVKCEGLVGGPRGLGEGGEDPDKGLPLAAAELGGAVLGGA